MDSLRGKFGFSDGIGDDLSWDDDDSDCAVDDSPPAAVGQDERRMQVRAYNFWAGLLGERTFPNVEDIESDNPPDFAPNSVLLDFTGGIECPAIAFLGDRLAGECGHDGPIETLDDVPSRSLLSRITDHYMQILANEAPIGFEAEFINSRGVTILYRGILLPFSTDDETIDFIYGVINWKEVADQLTTDELLLEIDNALEGTPGERQEEEPLPRKTPRVVISRSITRWADGPNASGDQASAQAAPESDESDDAEMPGEDADPRGEDAHAETQAPASIPSPTFARLDAHMGPGGQPAPDASDDAEPDYYGVESDPYADGDGPEEGPFGVFDPLAGIRQPRPDKEAQSGLHECLADARELAKVAHGAEIRSRSALYRAVARAYDVSLAAQEEPETYQRLLDLHAITTSARAPMTPVAKLVFGKDYDKSRLAEYAAVLAFAHREEIAAGSLADFLEHADGGLKGVVALERDFRRASDKPRAARPPRASAVGKRLAKLRPQPLDAIPADGSEYSLCVIRRTGAGEIAFLGEVADDNRLLARAARQLVTHTD